MSPTKSTQVLVQQMQLGGSTRRPLMGAALIAHENGTPEDRARTATEKLAKADADIAAREKLTQARTFAHEEFIHGLVLPGLVTNAKRCIEVDESALRALIRTAWDTGFTAGYSAAQKTL